MQGSGTKPSFANCTISRNRVTWSEGVGGGVVIQLASPTFTFTFITDNFAEYWGGGLVCVTGSGTQASFNKCTISGNSAQSLGGGGHGGGAWIVGNSIFTDTVFTDNTAGAMGGGMYIEGNGTRPLFNNCTNILYTMSDIEY